MSFPMRSSRQGLQGPRPSPLAISPGGSAKIAKRNKPRPPVVVYLRSPKVIHVQPEEFMGLVQRLTGNHSSCFTSSTDRCNNNSIISGTRVVGHHDHDDQNLNGDKNNDDDEDADFGGPTRTIACSPSPPSSSSFIAFDIPMC